MSEFESFVVYEGKGIRLTGWMIGEKLRLDLDATEPYFASIVHYELNEEDTHRLMSILGYEEFAGLFENGGQKWLEDFFEENGLSPTCTYYGINEIDQRFFEEGTFHKSFYEDDSGFDGHDYEYTFYFDRENSELLKQIILEDGRHDSISNWIKNEVSDQESGYDFMTFCKEHDIHGIRKVHEDYPGGVNYYIAF